MSVAVIVAVAVNAQGRREVLGITVMPSEAEAFGTELPAPTDAPGPARRQARHQRRARRARIGSSKSSASQSQSKLSAANCAPRLSQALGATAPSWKAEEAAEEFKKNSPRVLEETATKRGSWQTDRDLVPR